MFKKCLGVAAMLAVIVLMTGSSPMTASACGCGSWKGPVVASGTSPGGVTWKVMAVKHGHRNFSMIFDYSWVGGDASEFGFASGPYPQRRNPLVDGISGSGMGPENESDVAGVVSWRTKQLVIVMKSGERIRFKPVAAPAKLRKRWPWVKALRFYDQFFPGNLKPKRILALNARGEVIARMR